MNDFLCATDLTRTSAIGVHYADLLASKMHGHITLFHVMTGKERQGEERERSEDLLKAQAALVISCSVDTKVRDGNVLTELDAEAAAGYRMFVCSTHGPRGIRQDLFGSDILKLVRRLRIPSLVVQKQSPQDNPMSVIVLPVAGHEDIHQLLSSVSDLAKAFDAEVHIYQLLKPGDKAPPQLLANKAQMVDRMKKDGIRHKLVEEPSTKFSIGYALATIRYAERVKAGCIAIMSFASDDHRFIAESEKERMLINEPGIPVLCA